MRRRLDLAVSLIAAPPVLFLDEPTTGLDPRSRIELWDVLRGLVARRAPRCCSPRSTSRRPTSSPTTSSSSTRAGSSPRARRPQLKDQAGRASVVLTVSHAGRPAAAERAAARATSARCTSTPGARQLTAPADGLARHDPDRPACFDDQRHRRRRPGAEAAQPRRRVPAPDRPPGRGRRPTTADADERCRDREARDDRHDQQPSQRGRPEIRSAAPSLRSRLPIVVRRNLIHIKRMPEMLLDVTIQPVMFVLLFAFVFGGSIAVPGRRTTASSWCPGSWRRRSSSRRSSWRSG